jgi:hypothetical protein
MLTCLSLAVVPSLISCSSPDSSSSLDFKEGARVASPNGWVAAYVLEWSYGAGNGSTQVMLSFDGGRCGRGTLSADGTGLGLDLQWVEPAILQVTHPKSVDLKRGPGIEEEVQCGKRKVRVILSSRTSEARDQETQDR